MKPYPYCSCTRRDGETVVEYCNGHKKDIEAKIESLREAGNEVKILSSYYVAQPAKSDGTVTFKWSAEVSIWPIVLRPSELVLFAVPSDDRLVSPQVHFTYNLPGHQVPIAFSCDWSHAGYYAACDIANHVQLFCQLIFAGLSVPKNKMKIVNKTIREMDMEKLQKPASL